MSSGSPIVRQISWLLLLLQMLVVCGIIFIWYEIGVEDFVLYGLISYVFIAFLLRSSLTIDHRRGIRKVRKEKFKEAIIDFQKSYDFLKKHVWIDKLRYFTLLSSSRISYTEMSLNNIAFCYGQIGEGKKSKEYYEKTLKEFPNSGLAQAGLRMLNSMEKKENPTH